MTYIQHMIKLHQQSRCTTPRLSSMSSLQSKIEQKREELENLQELKKFTEILVKQLEQIEEKFATMADGAESVSLVLSNWKSVMNSVSLASLGLLKYSSKDFKDSVPLPECLVRIKLDKDDEPDIEGDKEELGVAKSPQGDK